MAQPDALTTDCRPARFADAETLAAFNVALAHESEGLALDPATVRAGVEAVLRDPARGRYFVAESEGRVIGQLMITYEWSDWRNAQLWWIQSVYVAPAHRRRGVFRQLYHHARGHARQAGDVCAIRLYVENDNTPAQSTYHAQGFTDASYRVYEATV